MRSLRDHPLNQGEREARDAGNPYDWNTPEWRIWNEGHSAAHEKFARFLRGAEERKRARPTTHRLGAHHPERMR